LVSVVAECILVDVMMADQKLALAQMVHNKLPRHCKNALDRALEKNPFFTTTEIL
jgi:hypothetical protein